MERPGFRYLRNVFTTALLALAVVAALNALVDPYGMYHWFERQGFNVDKPAIYNRVRLLKAYEVRRLRPESVALGSSRVHLGIRPSHAGWAAHYANRYNLAFDGATTKEMYAYLIHANAGRRLRSVLLGLDVYHLSSAPATVRPDFDPSILRTGNRWLDPLRMVAADLKLLTSISTLQESYATIEAAPAPHWYAADGQRLGEVFFRQPWEDFEACGPRCYFDEVDKREVSFKLAGEIPFMPNRNLAPASPDPLSSLDYIRKIVRFCRKNSIALVIFLTPSHAHQLELDAVTGNWSLEEQGRRELVNLVAAEGGNIPVYDFERYSAVTTEPLPPEGSKAEMRYYWDSSHFKDRVGDMVLDQIFGSHISPDTPRDFGVRLTPGNVDAAIASLDAGRKLYEARHPRDMKELENFVSEFREENGIPH